MLSPRLLNKMSPFKLFIVALALLLLLPGLSRAVDRAAPPPPPAVPAARPAPPAPPEPPDTRPSHGWLGVFLSDANGEGARITSVRDDSPAQKAGLREGDIIVELDGHKIQRTEDIRRAMRGLEPGDSLQIRVLRDTKKKTLKATLGKAPENLFFGHAPRWIGEGEAPEPFRLGLLGMTRNYLGVRVLSLTEDLRAYFKAPRGRGILISRVEDDTPAAKAGLRAGDVIIAVDGKGISDRGDISMALSDHKPGDRIPVKIVRDGSEKTVDVEIAERPGLRQRGEFLFQQDENQNLKRLQELSPEIEEAIREKMQRAREELERARLDEPEMQAQIAAALEKSRQSQMEQKELQRKIEEAMRKAREDLERATESMEDQPI